MTPDGQVAAPSLTRADPALVKALARAFRWQRLLDEGRYASISELARAEKIERGYLGKVLQLTLLAPAVVEAIVDGQQGADVRLPELMGEVPVSWSEQCGADREEGKAAACGAPRIRDWLEVGQLLWGGPPRQGCGSGVAEARPTGLMEALAPALSDGGVGATVL